jgi:hypothetical protein
MLLERSGWAAAPFWRQQDGLPRRSLQFDIDACPDHRGHFNPTAVARHVAGPYGSVTKGYLVAGMS